MTIGATFTSHRDDGMINRRQRTALLILLFVYALCAFLTYTFFAREMAAGAGMPMPDLGVSDAVLGLANAGIVLVLYGLLGLAALWLAGRIGLPGIYRESGNWRGWALIPLGLGLACGVLMVAGDVVFAPINGFGRMVHPGFPVSILASLSAGIGEEIAFPWFRLRAVGPDPDLAPPAPQRADRRALGR